MLFAKVNLYARKSYYYLLMNLSTKTRNGFIKVKFFDKMRQIYLTLFSFLRQIEE